MNKETRKLALESIVLPVREEGLRLRDAYDRIIAQWSEGFGISDNERHLQYIAECINNYEQVLAERDALKEMVEAANQIRRVGVDGGVDWSLEDHDGEWYVYGVRIQGKFNTALDAYRALKSEVE